MFLHHNMITFLISLEIISYYFILLFFYNKKSINNYKILFFYIIVNFLTSLLIFISIFLIIFKFQSFNLVFIKFLIKNNNCVYLYLFLLTLFIKIGLIPFFYIKLYIYKSLNFFTLYLYFSIFFLIVFVYILICLHLWNLKNLSFILFVVLLPTFSFFSYNITFKELILTSSVFFLLYTLLIVL